MFCEVGINGGLELSHRREASPANGLCSDASKETLDHVPGTARGNEVKVKAWCVAASDFWVLWVA